MINQISLIKSSQSSEVSDSVIFGASISYWEELNEFKIEEMLVNNEVPTLILHGEHDFQIPNQTHQEWKQRYFNNANYKLKLIPDMNHFLVIQSEGDNPLFYQEKKGISKKCLRQIEKWIKNLD